jgi:purine-binding chemotaxis protein CheW
MNTPIESPKGRLQLKSPDARTYCSFRLQNGLFGIDALAVKEITVLPTLTPIPHSPDAVRGYVNLRGQIVLVLDMNCLLQTGESSIGLETRLVVFRARLGDPFGILVDRIGDIVELSDEQIEKRGTDAFPRKGNGDSPQDALITGVGKLDNELLTLLDAGKLLPQIDAAIVQYYKRAYH